MTLVCEWQACSKTFERPGKRGPKPRFCSIKCRGKWQYSQPHTKQYQQEYARRPDRRLAAMLRGRARYKTEAYREWARNRWRRLYGDRFAGLVIPSPYTGHRWFDMARQAVGSSDVDPMYRDFGYDDEVGEAVLALLEGRDMREAVKEFRRKEYIPRHRTIRTGDWSDDGGEDKWFDGLATSPSAEEEVIARESVGYVADTKYHRGTNNYRNKGRHGRTQPSRRRMQDGRSWQKHGVVGV